MRSTPTSSFELVSPSAVYCRAAGVAPQTERTYAVDTTCAMCGTAIPAGTPCNAARGRFDASFNNKLDLVEGARAICGHCMALWSKDWLQKYSKTYACSDGVYKLASNLDQALFIAAPPRAPYVAILSSTQQQHLIWRAPVNYGREQLLLRVGDEILRIRRLLLLDRALPAWRALAAMMKEQAMAGTMPGPIDRELARFAMGRIRDDVAERAVALGLGAHVDLLNSLSLGEWWALGVVRQFDEATLAAAAPVLLATPSGRRLAAPAAA